MADFSDFDRGSKEASKNLLTFQQAADRAGGRLMDLGDRGAEVAPKVGTLTNQFRAFDNVLGAAGVSITSQVRALSDMEAAAGKTIGQLGGLTTAGLAAAAALAGWELGRLIADLAGTDKAVQTLWEHLLGFTAGAEEAAAKQEALNRASATAGRTITDYTEAIRINAAEADKQAVANGRWADASRQANHELSTWQRELRAVQSRGDMPALTRDIESHNFKLQDLSKWYGVGVDALQYFTGKLKDQATETKKAADAQLELAKGWASFYDWAADQEAARQAQLKAGFEAWRQQADAITANTGVLDSLLRKAAYDVAVAEDEARNKAAGLNAELEKMPAAAEPAAAGVMSVGSAAQQAGGFLAGMTAELYNAIRAAQAADSLNQFVPAFGRLPGGGISGPTPINPILRPLFVPAGGGLASGGGGVSVQNTFQIVDTEANIARRVSDYLTRSIMEGKRLS